MPEVRAFRDAKGAVELFGWMKDLRKTNPSVYAKCIARIKDLAIQGHQLRRPAADYLRDGVYELRPKSGHVNYRILYFFHKQIAVLTHGLTKEKEVPDGDIEYAIRCRTLVARDASKYTADLPDDWTK